LSVSTKHQKEHAATTIEPVVVTASDIDDKKHQKEQINLFNENPMIIKGIYERVKEKNPWYPLVLVEVYILLDEIVHILTTPSNKITQNFRTICVWELQVIFF
jgi:hypothetical protein